MVGLAHWTVGDLDAASRRYTESMTSLTAAGHISDVLGCSIALADIQLTLGQLSEAVRTYEAGLELARVHGVVRGTADMHVGLGEVSLERNDLAAAHRYLAASAGLGEQAGLPQHGYRWRVAVARLRRAEGDVTDALELLDEAERAYNTDMSPPVRPVAAVKARAQLAGGDLVAPRRWASERGLTADDDLDYVREYEHITLAHVLLATHAAETRSGCSRRLLTAADEGQRTGSAVDILVVLSLAHHARGDHTTATTALEQALARAAPEGYVRIFVDALPALTPLLRSASGQGAAGDHARHVLAPRRSTPARQPERLPRASSTSSATVSSTCSACFGPI